MACVSGARENAVIESESERGRIKRARKRNFVTVRLIKLSASIAISAYLPKLHIKSKFVQTVIKSLICEIRTNRKESVCFKDSSMR